jgi:hypothetical protein
LLNFFATRSNPLQERILILIADMNTSASILTPSKKLYAYLGELLHKKEPQTYAKLIQFVPRSDISPDLTNISNDFLSFCKVQNIEPTEYRGNIYKHSKTEQKSLFIAVIIVKYGFFTRNLAKNLAESLNQDKSWTCKMIKEADTRYRCLHEFHSQVDTILEKMKEVSIG